jgi:uncharacterized protein involved in exopolysaccharide biosynthesis
MNAHAQSVDVLPTEPEGGNLLERFAALRRRSPQILTTLGTLLGLTLLTALLWPPKYESTGIVLIEQQEVPEEFVRSAVTSYADQRVKMISQRVMTTANLLDIIRKYDLYPDRQRREPREKLLKRMRDDIGLEMISADVVDPTQGKATKATIAFAVSYLSRSPEEAAKVANELTTLYLNENIETRRQLAADTAQFLKQEADRVGKEVAELDQRIAAFKSANADALPELTQVNLQLMTRVEEELRGVETRMLALDQQALFLDSQLAQVSPTSGAVTETGQRMLSSEDRLKYLKTQLASARSLYEPDHPDVIRLTREVAGLERELGGQNAGNELVRQLQETRKQLGQARARYSAEHPDVRRLERFVDAMEDAMRRAGQTATPTVSTAKPDNPAFIQLRAQKDAVTTERAALARQRDQLRARVSDLTSRMSAAPGVEREYSALARDLQGAQLKYQEVRQKQMAAQLAQNLETEQKGERFTLIEPPLVPEQPATPNRALILVLGSLLSVAAAIAFAMLVESVDGRVRGSRDLAGIVGVPPLAVIPWVELDEERKSRRGRWRIWLAAAAAGLLALLALVHFLYRPLDVLWSVVLRRLWL